MKIKNVEATWLRVPIPEARQYACDLDGRAGPQVTAWWFESSAVDGLKKGRDG